MQREVSWKSTNNKRRKAHECYQAASLLQSIKNSGQTDDPFSEQVEEWRKAQDFLLQGGTRNLGTYWEWNIAELQWEFKELAFLKYRKQPETFPLAIASKKEMVDSKQWETVLLEVKCQVNGYWRGKGRKNSKRHI